MSTTSKNSTTVVADTGTGPGKAYAAIIGVTSLIILLQAVWAGLFIQEGEDYKQKWVDVHARAADLAIALAIIATVLALVKLRHRMDLVVGTAALAVLLVVEAYIGGLIGDHSKLTVVHFPIGMALMGLSVWLPLRVARRTPSAV